MARSEQEFSVQIVAPKRYTRKRGLQQETPLHISDAPVEEQPWIVRVNESLSKNTYAIGLQEIEIPKTQQTD